MSRIIVADPAWKFRDKLSRGRGAASHYTTSFIEQNAQHITDHITPETEMLFLWTVASMTEEAIGVMRLAGFRKKAEIVWCKTTRRGKRHFGMGHYVRNEHETCWICVREGLKKIPKMKSRSIRSVLHAPMPCYADTGKIIHSAKPAEFYKLVEDLVEGPYTELFARRYRPGWACFGDELKGGTT
jgi:N6-adenosine-specific RNA methylase IME4